MDFLKDCFEQHDDAYIEHLQIAGYSTEQARQFMPEAASRFAHRARNKGAGQITAQLAEIGLARFIGPGHLDAICEKLGMDSAQVRMGLAAITPVLAKTIARKADSLSGRASSTTRRLFNRIG